MPRLVNSLSVDTINKATREFQSRMRTPSVHGGSLLPHNPDQAGASAVLMLSLMPRSKARTGRKEKHSLVLGDPCSETQLVLRETQSDGDMVNP